jgi:phenylacetate-CoA ligase
VIHCLNYQMWMGGVTDHLTLEQTGATVVAWCVVADERLIEVAIETAARIGELPTTSVQSMKRILNRTTAFELETEL